MRDKEKPVKPVVKSVIEPISVPEMREAERSIVNYVWEKHFKEEIECLDGCYSCGSKATAQRRFS